MYTLLIPLKIGGMDAGPHQSLRPLQSAPFFPQQALEFLKIVRRTISDSSFHQGPYKFVGIEFWGIARKMMMVNPRVARQEVFQDFGFVRLDVIPQENDRPRNVSKQMAKELNHFFGLDILIRMELQKEVHPSLLRCRPDSRNGRNLSPPTGSADQECLTLRRPTAHNQGNHEKATFIEKDNLCSKAFSFFLIGARPIASTFLCPLIAFLGPLLRFLGAPSQCPH
jgi:hypothetical protein